MPRLYVAADLIDAQLLADALRSHGIDSRIVNTHAVGALGELSFADAWPEVWVGGEHDVARAAPLVAAHGSRASGEPDRCCAACGETSPASFASCWQCGAWIAPAEAS